VAPEHPGLQRGEMRESVTRAGLMLGNSPAKVALLPCAQPPSRSLRLLHKFVSPPLLSDFKGHEIQARLFFQHFSPCVAFQRWIGSFDDSRDPERKASGSLSSQEASARGRDGPGHQSTRPGWSRWNSRGKQQSTGYAHY
jgi:hypothetical protein